MIRVLLADDQAMIRQGFSYILRSQTDMLVIGEACHGEEAISMAQEKEPDVILMDIRMPVKDGLVATREILTYKPGIKIVLLTTFDTQEYVFEGIRSGAVGYLLKDAETADLLDAIRSANRGEVVFRTSKASEWFMQYASQKMTYHDENSKISKDEFEFELLTDRELEVLQAMANGNKNSEIALTLHVSEGTVKTHVHRILQKFGVDDRTQAVVLALRKGIVQ